VGEVLYRLCGRLVMDHWGADMGRTLLPLQFGVGVPCGVEIMTRYIDSVLTAHPDWVLLRLDVENAFNSIERAPMFEAVQASPYAALLPLLYTFYEGPSALIYQAGGSSEVLESVRGVRQGDPLGPFLYAITLQPALEAAQHAFAEDGSGARGRAMGYLDDVALVGPRSTIAAAYEVYRTELQLKGQFVNPGKSELYCPEGLPPPAGLEDIPVSRDGVTMLGVPLGSDDYVAAQVRDRLQAFVTVLPALHELPSQIAFSLLRQCIARRAQYLTRALACTRPGIAEALSSFDDSIWGAFMALLPGGACLHAGHETEALLAARHQAVLPIRMGGMGLTSVSDFAALSHLSSWVQTAALLAEHFPDRFLTDTESPYRAQLESLLPASIAAMIPSSADAATTGYPARLFQTLSAALHDHALEDLRDIARTALHPEEAQECLRHLTGAAAPGAGAWLLAHPRSSEDFLALHGPDWGIAAALRLRLPVTQLQDVGVCACAEGATLDPDAPLHALRCRAAFTTGGVSAMTHQHATVRDAVAGVVSSSGLGGSVVKEDRGFFEG